MINYILLFKHMSKYAEQFNIKNSLAVQNVCLLHWIRSQKYNHILAFLKDQKWITCGYQAMLFAALEMTKKLIDNFSGLLQETGIISLTADWHILSDIIPETINMGDISAPYYLLISKVADCNVSWHLSAWQTLLLVSFLAIYPYKTQLVGIQKKYTCKWKLNMPSNPKHIFGADGLKKFRQWKNLNNKIRASRKCPPPPSITPSLIYL